MMGDLPVLFQSLGKHENIIQIDYNDSFSYQLPENIIHHCLEGGRTVGESKEHDQGLKKTTICPKSCFPLISRFNANIIESPTNVELGEVLGTLELINELRNEWERVLVLHSNCIEGLVVLNQSEGPILLLNEEDRRGHRRLRRTNPTSG